MDFDEISKTTAEYLEKSPVCGCTPVCASIEAHHNKMMKVMRSEEPVEFSGGTFFQAMAENNAELNERLDNVVVTGLEVPSDPEPPYKDCSCLRCGLDWHARNPQKRPSSCPRCGSALWDKPPVNKNARRPSDPPNPNWNFRLKPIKKKCPTCGRPMRRLTVAERQEMEEKKRMVEQGTRAAIEEPARPRAVTTRPADLWKHRPAGTRSMTPPPILRGPTPPPLRPSQAETPETQASRRTLSDELKGESS